LNSSVTALQLTSEALDIVSNLASIQPEEDGKETLERLHDILARGMEVGVEAALAEFSFTVSSDDMHEARLERERQRLRAARRALPIKAPYGPSATMLAKGLAFDSLRECRAYLLSQYPQTTISVVAKDANSRSDDEAESIQMNMPGFMFRGESGLFPTTQTSIMRLRGDLSLSSEAIETIIALNISIRDQLIEQMGLSPRLATAFLQHYGLPTQFFDVSPDLNVAVEFATNLSPGDWGAIAALPVKALLEDSQSITLIDLTMHTMAERPRRQNAYAYVDYKHSDLKNLEAISDRKLAWHWFRFTVEDEESQNPNLYLLDAHSDDVAGLIELFINDAAKFDDGAARWLSQHVPAAPTVLRIVESKDDSIEAILIPAEDAGAGPFVSSESSNYMSWSMAFPSLPTPKEVPEIPGSTAKDLPAGATLWALRPRFFQRLRSMHEDDP
jgi:hypothetical protein